MEADTEITPKGQTELSACLHQTEEGLASDFGSGAAADRATGDLAPDVVFRAVGVQRDLGAVERPLDHPADGTTSPGLTAGSPEITARAAPRRLHAGPARGGDPRSDSQARSIGPQLSAPVCRALIAGSPRLADCCSLGRAVPGRRACHPCMVSPRGGEP
jgi:hypothetical protein